MSIRVIPKRLILSLMPCLLFGWPTFALAQPILSISLSIYSGRPDPSWSETNPVEISKIASLLHAASSAPQIDYALGCFSVEHVSSTGGPPINSVESIPSMFVCKHGISTTDTLGRTSNLHDNGELYTYLINSAIRANENPPMALRGDLDGNDLIDQADINTLLQDQGKATSKSACGLRCDLDNDGTITALDAQKLVTFCTYPHCASKP